MGALASSVALGLVVYVAFGQPRETLAQVLPSQVVEVVQGEGLPLAAAVLTSCMSFLAVQVFCSAVVRVSDAVLYCFLWDKQDGVLDAKQTPEGFKRFQATLGDAGVRDDTETS